MAQTTEFGALLVIARELSEAVKLLGNQVVYLETRLDEMNSQLENITAACPGL